MVSILYTRSDSIYNSLGVDCWDINRDARNWPGGNSIVAHPPCRAWGQLSHMAKPRPDEKYLAIDAIAKIRKYGGILEHPRASKLWHVLKLPLGNEIDEYGGYTLFVNQHWWGHKAQKKTLLYICGVDRSELPAIPLSFDLIEYWVMNGNRRASDKNYMKLISKRERESTPIDFAKWLIAVAEKCNKN